LRDRVLRCGIVGRTLDRTKAALTGYAPLQLSADFVSAAFFHWISAATRQEKNHRQQ
jgi:hypothetical protein